MIKLHDLYFKTFISEEEIDAAVQRMVDEISNDIQDEIPVFVGILNGSFMFVSDFVKKYPKPCEVTFIKLASYEGLKSSEDIHRLIGLTQDLSGRKVVILEDIIDSGNTLSEVYRIFKNEQVDELKIATLFYKPEAYKKDFKLHYVGIEIPNKFIVGYGLDYNGLGRDLPSVYQLKTTQHMTNLVLFGPPGAGKGTQAEFLKNTYNLVHISTGDVFRFNIKNETALGMLAKSYMDKGELVPDQVTIDMLNAEVEKNADANGFIFDGFPRTNAQAEALDKLMDSKDSQINAMIALEVDDEILVQRLLKRGETSGRKDDADESIIRNRIKEYYKKTAILKDYYTAQDKYYGVDGEGSIEEITERLNAVIDSL
ncbi:adenylate kinase [Psychroserpens sp.]|uniref:adenylate kinase n=1 Tax=Psychroserpens sp. TaxID=2020870 RepID=UPI001B27BBF1|nr:adenylate kinase [Psychroserpens sp.]MBO6606189.1 adenylate kinase [Psychroserpens sp.]MBO6631451.1 adenylate kinase [Psychroserpens sp.]MBO6652439.1 adenylate kinase [Psychroserpens sp.]MBO6681789.1 adenylate kinase [Psychroserpens sp.]MBO6749564.1 adenylate kinase [Psychroserpens sp.]